MKTVKPSTVEACFVRAGIKPFPDEDDVLPPSPPEDDDEPLANLLTRFQALTKEGDLMTAAEYKTLYDSLPSHCDDEESLDSNSQETIEDDDESSEDSKLRTYKISITVSFIHI